MLSSEISLERWAGKALGYGSKSRGIPGSERSEDAFCEAEPRLAEKGLHIDEVDMAQNGAKRPASHGTMQAHGACMGRWR